MPKLAEFGYMSAAEKINLIRLLRASLEEMVEVYWGKGDGQKPPPACIIRAQSALKE